jgi:hypothetical protein
MSQTRLPDDELIKQAVDLVSNARSKGIELRTLGAVAVYLHCLTHDPALTNLYSKLSRLGEGKPLFTDLDLIAYSSQRSTLMKFLEKDMRLTPNLRFNSMFALRRMIYYHGDEYSIDVFFDKLEYSHDVPFGNKPQNGRLNLDFPTITLADIVLEKLQIHDINQKDIIDLNMLFLYHDVANGISGTDLIDGSRILQFVADDWGFWHDATTNLRHAITLSERLLGEGKLSEGQTRTIRSRMQSLLDMMEKAPKTDGWQKRAKIGASKPWYRDVEEVRR